MPGEEFAPLSSRDRSREYDLSFWYPFITGRLPLNICLWTSAESTQALLRMLRAPAPSIIAFFHRVKYLRCIAFEARIDPRAFLRGSLIFVTDHCVDPSGVARSSFLVRRSMRESYDTSLNVVIWSHCCTEEFEKIVKMY